MFIPNFESMRTLNNESEHSKELLRASVESLVEKEYPLKIEETTELRDGPDNVIYRLTTQDNHPYIFRLSKRELLTSDLEYEAHIIQQLSQNNFPVAQWIATNDERPFVSTDIGSYGVLFEHIAGSELSIDTDTKPKLDVVHEAGMTLGQLHSITHNMDVPFERARDQYTEINRVLNNQERFLSHFAEGHMFTEQLTDIVQRVSHSSIDQKGVIHHDFRAQNLLLDPTDNTHIQAVLDFDWSCNGSFGKDLGLALAEWSFPSGASEPWEDVFDTMLVGYNERAPIPIKKTPELFEWAALACISDAATYFSDLIDEEQSGDQNIEPKKLQSYMYTKFNHFYSQAA